MKTNDRNYHGVKLPSGTVLVCEDKGMAERVRKAIKASGVQDESLMKKIAGIAYSAYGTSVKEILYAYTNLTKHMIGA